MHNSAQNGSLLSLLEIYKGKSFRVPNYQRAYSWERPQIEDLVQDISNMLEHDIPGYRHYAGTIVAIHHDYKSRTDAWFNPPPPQTQLYDLVDGQQRLTTIAILLSELATRIETDNRAVADRIRHNYLTDLTNPRDPRRRFTASRDSDNFFYNNIICSEPLSDTPQNKSHINLTAAKGVIQQWLDKRSSDELYRALEVIERRFGFLLYIAETSAEVGLMFEIINNRGKRLSELEKVKNFLVYFSTRYDAPAIADRLNSVWPDLLADLARADALTNIRENAFLNNVWTLYRRDDHSTEPYGGLKQLGNDPDALLEFLNLMVLCARALARLTTQSGVELEERLPLERLNLQPSISGVMPLIFAISIRENNAPRRAELLDLIERLNFRFYGCGIAKRSDSKQGTLFALANTYYRKFKTPAESGYITTDWLEDQMVKFVAENASDRSLVKALTLDEGESGDFYNWKGLKFFLASYEEHIAKKQFRSVDVRRMLLPEDDALKCDFYHCEHLWAQRSEDRFKDQPQHRNKRRLGNFVLLEGPINTRVSNRRLHEKVRKHFFSDAYRLKPNTSMLDELKEMLETAENDVRSQGRINKTANYWLETYTRFMDLRETKLINFGLERWAVPYDGLKITNFRVDSVADPNNENYASLART